MSGLDTAQMTKRLDAIEANVRAVADLEAKAERVAKSFAADARDCRLVVDNISEGLDTIRKNAPRRIN